MSGYSCFSFFPTKVLVHLQLWMGIGYPEKTLEISRFVTVFVCK